MTAKILLGAVVLAAIAGSPIAYNHFTSSTGGTQKEEDNIEAPQEERRLVSSQTPEEQPRVPEIKIEKPQLNEAPALAKPPVEEKGPEQKAVANNVQDPKKNDECKLKGTTTWTRLGPLDPKMHCVRDTAISTRRPS